MAILKKSLIATFSIVVSWLALSYLFFPIKLSASPEIYFIETVTHMVPLKTIITIIVTLLIVFMYEQKTKKSK